jgi:outer membrane protein OmpA-like peptidoglycan-associated protein
MRGLNRTAIAVLAIVACAATASAQSEGRRIAFVSCPVLRNTEPVPCWLGAYKGELYYLGPQGDLQADFYPPQFNHRMLVEGELTNERYCGGIVVRKARASVLPDIDPACNVILPAMGYKEREDLRGPGPSGHRGGPPEPPRPRPPTAAPFTAPFTPREFVAGFDADGARLWREAQAAVNEAARYVRASGARRVTVTGHRAAIRLMDGDDYVERETLAEERARAVAEALRTVGLPPDTKVEVRWNARPRPATGTAGDAEARRVVIVVSP